jgi:hypothetical protein
MARLVSGKPAKSGRPPASSAAGCTRPRTCSASRRRASSRRPTGPCGRFGWPRPMPTPRLRSMRSLRATEVKYEKATECLNKDRDALLTFYDFPPSTGSTAVGAAAALAHCAGAAQSTIRRGFCVWPHTHAPYARRQHESRQGCQGRLAVCHAQRAPGLHRLGTARIQSAPACGKCACLRGRTAKQGRRAKDPKSVVGALGERHTCEFCKGIKWLASLSTGHVGRNVGRIVGRFSTAIREGLGSG